MRRTCAALAVLVGVLGCGSKSDDKGSAPTPAPERASAAPTAQVTAAPAPSAQAPTAPASAAVAPSAQAPAVAATAALPPGRTPMPTLEEWNKERKEVTVKGSSALGCETKIVREYLRVACAGKNDTGGTPTTVRVDRGGRGEAMTVAADSVTILIVPFIMGIDFAATFSWTDKSHTLVVKWPHNAPKPQTVGVFEGASSPLAEPSGAAVTAGADKLCACHKQLFKVSTCDQLMGAPNVDCERTYDGDCEKLLACSRGEKTAIPKCMPGFVNAYFGRCFRECGAGKPDCPTHMLCEESGEFSICVEQQ
ncbi:MAG: hypothetical protein IT372_22225 [Polyangiaceae bacterium]|nr:hypothetical protein [Polyangiaceae bacterium]